MNAVKIIDVGGEGTPFQVSVDGWVDLLSAAMVDPTAAQIIENAPELQQISFRLDRLSPAELMALGAVTRPGERDAWVQMAVGVRIVCESLAMRISVDAIEKPQEIAALLAEARVSIQGAEEFVRELTQLEDSEEIRQVKERTLASVDRLKEETAQFEVFAETDFASAASLGAADEHSDDNAADRFLDTWRVVLTVLRTQSKPQTENLARSVTATSQVVAKLLTRFGDQASEASRSAFEMAYEEWLSWAAGTLAVEPEVRAARAEFSRIREPWSGREKRASLAPDEPPATDASKHEATKTASGIAIEPRSAAELAHRRRTVGWIAVAAVLLTTGVFSYVNFVHPRANFAVLDVAKIGTGGKALSGGYLVMRKAKTGNLFVGKLRAAEKDLAAGELVEILRQVRNGVEPRGVSEVLLMDRFGVPVVTWRRAGGRVDGRASSVRRGNG